MRFDFVPAGIRALAARCGWLALSLVLFLGLVATALTAQSPNDAAYAKALAYAARTDAQAVLVMYRGRIVRETYLRGGAPTRRLLLASGSKSFVGVATLAAVHDGLLSLDEPVAAHLPAWRSDAGKSRITVRQLLSLESGLEPGRPGTGCGGRRATWADAIAARSIAPPGTRFAYGPYPFITMGAAIEQASGESFATYLSRRIFTPLGITVEWRLTCGDGKPQLAGGAAVTARDWATFGEFIRRGGMHGDTRILPDSLVRQLVRPSGSNPVYGLSWWLVGATTQTRPALAPESAPSDGAPPPTWMPADLFMAAGAGKQRLYVIPSRELVIVRMGPVLGGRRFRDIDFLEPLLAPR